MKLEKKDITDFNGQKVNKVDLKCLEGIKPNEHLVHFVQNAILRNTKLNRSAHYKAVSAVNRTHKKPFRQKGTGRARQGSLKGIHMIGGGVAFGFDLKRPAHAKAKHRSAHKVNDKMKKSSLAHVLKNKLDHNCLQFVDWEGTIPQKTKEVSERLSAVLEQKKGCVFIQKFKDQEKRKSMENIHTLRVKHADSFNLVDLLKGHFVMIDVSALKKVSDCLGNELRVT